MTLCSITHVTTTIQILQNAHKSSKLLPDGMNTDSQIGYAIVLEPFGVSFMAVPTSMGGLGCIVFRSTKFAIVQQSKRCSGGSVSSKSASLLSGDLVIIFLSRIKHPKKESFAGRNYIQCLNGTGQIPYGTCCIKIMFNVNAI
jgi:hypothetical protein